MSATVTFRLDPETARILRELTRREKTTRSRLIKTALRDRWKSDSGDRTPSAREIYASQNVPHAKPKHDHARRVEELLKEILLEKRRKGTL